MTKQVLDVGNCGPDHSAIRHVVESNFDAAVTQAHAAVDALDLLRAGHFDLVLINRKLDRDYSDGMAIIHQIKADAELAHTPVMMITNFADHQKLAVDAGAEPGFGKLELNSPQTLERLARHLESKQLSDR